MNKILLAAAIMLCLAAAAFPGCNPAPTPPAPPAAVISDFFTTDRVTNGTPGAPAKAFAAETQSVYIACKVNGASDNTTVTAQMFLVKDAYGQPVGQMISESSTQVTGTKSLAFRLNKKDMDWRRGDYRAVILVNGKEAASQDFKIRFSMAEGKQVPIVRLFGFMPDKVEEGQASVLWWFVEDGQGVEIAGLGPVETQGYKIMAPGESCRYTLTASNAEGTITANAALTVSKPEAGDRPDLVITAFETDGPNVTCTVKNIGGAACGPLDVIISFIKENRYSPLAKCTGLAPGEEQKLTFAGYAWPLKAHSWTVPFTVCVNALDASAEANTQNNCLTLIW